MWQNSSCDKTQILTKVKFWQKSKCDNSQIVKKKIKKITQYDKNQIVTKVKTQSMTNLKNENCEREQKIVRKKT